jgi:hypothetical protein
MACSSQRLDIKQGELLSRKFQRLASDQLASPRRMEWLETVQAAVGEKLE